MSARASVPRGSGLGVDRAADRCEEQRRTRGSTSAPAEEPSVWVTSPYPFVGGGWTTAIPYGLLPVATVAVVLKVLGSMIDSVLAPWLAT